jgi:hypothetical protein
VTDNSSPRSKKRVGYARSDSGSDGYERARPLRDWVASVTIGDRKEADCTDLQRSKGYQSWRRWYTGQRVWGLNPIMKGAQEDPAKIDHPAMGIGRQV